MAEPPVCGFVLPAPIEDGLPAFAGRDEEDRLSTIVKERGDQPRERTWAINDDRPVPREREKIFDRKSEVFFPARDGVFKQFLG